MPTHQFREFGIGLGRGTLRSSLDPGQGLVEPSDRMGQPLICHEILTSTDKRPRKRLSPGEG